MRKLKSKSIASFASGLLTACLLFAAFGADSKEQNPPGRYDMDVIFTGKALLLNVIDRQTNTGYLYNRMTEDTYELKETIDLSQAGQKEMKISPLDEDD